jgi:hypothetical protein
MTSHIHDCFSQLDDELIWRRESSENSLGNLVLHLCGNVRQWIGCYVGGLEDIRKRPEEFSPDARLDRTALLALLDQTIGSAVLILQQVEPARLADRILVQDGRVTSVLEAIYQVVGHFQQHTGQIIFATKRWTGKDLGFYRPPSR